MVVSVSAESRSSPSHAREFARAPLQQAAVTTVCTPQIETLDLAPFPTLAAAPIAAPPRRRHPLAQPHGFGSLFPIRKPVNLSARPPISAELSRASPSAGAPEAPAGMKATASMCSPRTVRGTHTFKIAGYSLHRGLGAGRYAFDVGGYLWRIEYYPDAEMEMKNGDYASVSLELVTTDAQARAAFEVRLVDQASKLPPSVVLARSKPMLFRSNPPTYMSEDFLQPLPYLHADDSLLVECDITVINESELASIATTFDIKVPPSDLSRNLKELLETGEETDVAFEVRGEVFPAHKLVLAMRSRVFKADLFGPMGDRTRKTVPIEDMQPAVFGALLHFIYTDSLPSMEHLVGDDAEEMVKHLLVAADRYAMERMKVLCESILCRTLNVRNVTTTLALADQHQCSHLKDACLDFITSPDRTDDVVASEGYACLKRTCPAVIADIFERATKSRKI